MTAGLVALADMVQTQAAGGSGYSTYRGTLPTKPPGAYVMLYFTSGHTASTRLARAPRDLLWQFRAICAGYSDRQALNTADLIRARFEGWRPLGANGPTLNEDSDNAPLLRDDTVPNDVRFSLTLSYRLTLPVGTPTEVLDSRSVQVGHGPPTSSTLGFLYYDLDTGNLYRLTGG